MSETKHKITIELDGDVMVFLHRAAMDNNITLEQFTAATIEAYVMIAIERAKGRV